MKSVLIVDDAAFMRLALRSLLEKNGYTVVGEADNGKSGVAKYMQLTPDIVTLDITMPEMDGIEALQEIMKIDRKATVIIVSAMGQESKVREAVIHGAKNFIVKPFKDEHVLQTLCKY
jgi:two-component system chemotaxis response regulator CheY